MYICTHSVCIQKCYCKIIKGIYITFSIFILMFFLYRFYVLVDLHLWAHLQHRHVGALAITAQPWRGEDRASLQRAHPNSPPHLVFHPPVLAKAPTVNLSTREKKNHETILVISYKISCFLSGSYMPSGICDLNLCTIRNLHSDIFSQFNWKYSYIHVGVSLSLSLSLSLSHLLLLCIMISWSEMTVSLTQNHNKPYRCLNYKFINSIRIHALKWFPILRAVPLRRALSKFHAPSLDFKHEWDSF